MKATNLKATLDEGHQMMADLDYRNPVPVSAEIGTLGNDTLTITFDKDLDPLIVPVATAFTTTGVTGNYQPTGITIAGQVVTLTLAGNARCDDVITIDYDSYVVNNIVDVFGNPAWSFTAFSVTNNIIAGTDDEPLVHPNGTAYLLCQNQLNLSLKNPVEFEFRFYLNQFITINSKEGIFEVYNNSDNWVRISITPDNAFYGAFAKSLRFTYEVGGINNISYFQNFFNVVPGWYKIKFIWSGTSLQLYRNDILFSGVIINDLNNMVQDAGCDFWLMNNSTDSVSIKTNNRLIHFKYKTNGVLITHYPVCEEGGNTAYNVVSNAYHLTGQSGYNALTWSRDNDQEKYLRDYGYRLTGGIYIPGLLSGASAADGNPLTEWSPCTEFN